MPDTDKLSLKESLGGSLRPDILTPSQSLDLIGKKPPSTSHGPMGDYEIDLDVFGFGLKLEYDFDFDDDGYFPSALFLKGSTMDLKDELETNQPEAYKKLCSHIHETHNQPNTQ